MDAQDNVNMVHSVGKICKANHEESVMDEKSPANRLAHKNEDDDKAKVSKPKKKATLNKTNKMKHKQEQQDDTLCGKSKIKPKKTKSNKYSSYSESDKIKTQFKKAKTEKDKNCCPCSNKNKHDQNDEKKQRPRSRCTDVRRKMREASKDIKTQTISSDHGESIERDRALRSGTSLVIPHVYVSREARLLEDRTLGYHAWSLWASNQRRPYQQANPNASAESVENSLRELWDTVDDKEKLKYFQRAVRAQRRSTRYRQDNTALKRKNDTMATSVDIETFSHASKSRQEVMVANSLLHLQQNLPAAYFKQMIRTLHCDRGICCQVYLHPYSSLYPGHLGRECCKDRKQDLITDVKVHTKSIWDRLTAEVKRLHAVQVEYARWRIAQNRKSCTDYITKALVGETEKPKPMKWFEDQSQMLQELLGDLYSIEKDNVDHISEDFGRCKEGHDMISQIATELEISTQCKFQWANESVLVPTIVNTSAEISLLADAVSSNNIPTLSLEEVDDFFFSLPPSTIIMKPEHNSQEDILNAVFMMMSTSLNAVPINR